MCFVNNITWAEIQEIDWYIWMLIALPILYAIGISYYMYKLIHKDLKILERRVPNLEEKYYPFERLDREN